MPKRQGTGLTKQQKQSVRKWLRQGHLFNREIAARLGVPLASVNAVKAWRTRKELTRPRSSPRGPDLTRIPVIRKTGDESFHTHGTPRTVRLREFWSWADSDLLGTAVRGRLAEYLVARALGVADGVRRDWTPFDLAFEGLAIEVKSASYIQTWAQRQDTNISFEIGPTRTRDLDRGVVGTTRRRHAHVYVFALLKEQRRGEVDPLDLGQWTFYVLRTKVLEANTKLRTQKRLSLGRLEKLVSEPVQFDGLREAVRKAYPDEPSIRS